MKQTRGVRTMERVLDAALACFTFRGIYDATIEDLARRSQVSVGSIYHHFGSRDGVALALYRRSMESLLAAVTRAVRRQRSARAGVTTLVRSYLQWVRAHRDEARFIYAAGQTDFIARAADDVGAWKQELLAPLLAWFAPHIERGALVQLPLPLYEIMMIGPPAELARRWLTPATDLDMDAAIKLLPETIWRSLRP